MWLWTIAAPASMHASASVAISVGSTGTFGLAAFAVVPLIAHSMITSSTDIPLSSPDPGEPSAPLRPSRSDGRTLVGHLAELVLQDLVERAQREPVDGVHGPRHLEVGEPLAAGG